jgi:hypothetical protein
MRNKNNCQLAKRKITVNVFNGESNVKDNNIATTYGFYNRYFTYLKTSKTQNEAFVKASVDYFNLNQCFKYSSFNHFKSAYHAS